MRALKSEKMIQLTDDPKAREKLRLFLGGVASNASVSRIAVSTTTGPRVMFPKIASKRKAA